MDGILNISEAVSLAIHGMVYLADSYNKDGGVVSVKDIAKVFKASEHHLSKVFQRLVKAGLIRSIRGPHGGFCLARPANRIRLIDVFTAIDGELSLNECLFLNKVCMDGRCIFGSLLKRINSELFQYLKGKRLSDFRGVYGKEKIGV